MNNIKNITEIVLKGVALAMGIAIVVMNTLGTLELTSAVPMLGLGLAALALASFQK